MLLHAIKSVKRFFTQYVIAEKKKNSPLSKENILTQLNTNYMREISRYFHDLQELKAGQSIELTTISVTINQLSSILLTTP